MSLVDRAGAGPAPNFVPSFNPLIFSDSLTVSNLPNMLGASSPALPNLVPAPEIGSRHTDMADEAAQQVTAQYTVLNPSTGEFSGSLLAASDLLFCSGFPRTATDVMLNSAHTPVYGFTLSMMNAFLRAQWLKAAPLLSPTASLRTGATSGMKEYDLIDYHLRLETDKHPLYDNKTSSAFAGTQTEKLNLHYAFGMGVMKRVRFLGPSVAQSNSLYSVASENITSMTAENGASLLSVGFNGPLICRNFWGEEAVTGKHLWLLLKPYHGDLQDNREITENKKRQKLVGERQDSALQFVPYVGRGFSNEVDLHQRVYKNVVDETRAAQAIYVGQVLSVFGFKTLSSEVYELAAGLAPDATYQPGPGESFRFTEQLPLLQINVPARPWGSYVLYNN